MKNLRSVLSLFFIVVCCQALSAATVIPPTNETIYAPGSYEIIRAEFGVFNQEDSSKPAFVQAAVIPLTPNQNYGWIMLLRTAKLKVKWREEFTLPEKPDTWGDPATLGNRSVSPDGRTSITEREVSPDQGLIYNIWTVAPGDPKGRYLIKVFIEDSLAKLFEFDVQ